MLDRAARQGLTVWNDFFEQIRSSERRFSNFAREMSLLIAEQSQKISTINLRIDRIQDRDFRAIEFDFEGLSKRIAAGQFSLITAREGRFFLGCTPHVSDELVLNLVNAKPWPTPPRRTETPTTAILGIRPR